MKGLAQIFDWGVGHRCLYVKKPPTHCQAVIYKTKKGAGLGEAEWGKFTPPPVKARKAFA